MKNFLKIGQVDVTALALEVARQPGLWNRNMARLSPRGPHAQTDDIWLRYKDESENIASGDYSNFADEHEPIWYPAYAALPAARKVIFDLMHFVQGERLGGVLIYRVPPGKQILTHTDKGWHPEHFEKFNVNIQSQPGCAFVYPEHGEAMASRTGDVFWFKNTVPHNVVNDSKEDQIIMTVCIKTAGG